ncbi:MAG: hypothetical protein F4X91_13205 [Nitrospinae bacterium]|nr:hypothetical protein [Nitrospinota bacterium]
MAERSLPFPLKSTSLVLRGQTGLSQVVFEPVFGKKYSSHSLHTEPMSLGLWREFLGIVKTSRINGTTTLFLSGTKIEGSFWREFMYYPAFEVSKNQIKWNEM